MGLGTGVRETLVQMQVLLPDLGYAALPLNLSFLTCKNKDGSGSYFTGLIGGQNKVVCVGI